MQCNVMQIEVYGIDTKRLYIATYESSAPYHYVCAAPVGFNPRFCDGLLCPLRGLAGVPAVAAG